jgi:hypothetical protein
MSYPNQEFTEHEMFHRIPYIFCEYCMDKPTMKFVDTIRYQNELRNCWMKMVEKYPEHYTMEDYYQACDKVGIHYF